MKKHDLPCSRLPCFASRLTGSWRSPASTRRDLRRGQAYTEYVLILLFGVFLGLGIVVVDRTLLPEQLRIMNRLYGYIFDYYAGLANYLNLPLF